MRNNPGSSEDQAALSTQERFKRGAADAGRYWQFMAEFVGFSEEHAAAIRETRFIIEKYIPSIVADFYVQLLRYPETRKHFQRRDGTIDQEYVERRMSHQASFWRRAASGEYSEDFARFLDYVGRAHTSRGADPRIYIPERYVMGMVGFVQQRIGEALATELHEIDPELEVRALKAWNTFLMVLLELLARPYDQGRDVETFEAQEPIDEEAVRLLAVETYERDLGMARSIEIREVLVGQANELLEGERRIITVENLSIGVFHHQGRWYALHNSCLHRGGPVCEGSLEGDTLTCPWHGYQYNLPDGQLLLDRSAHLPMYPVTVREGQVYIRVPILVRDPVDISFDIKEAAIKVAQEQPEDLEPGPETEPTAAIVAPAPLAENEFRLADLSPGEIGLVYVEGWAVAVYNVDGTFYATQDECSHADGPLSDGDLDGQQVTCPWHGSCFDVTSGAVLCGPATEPLRMYRVITDGDIGRVESF